MAVYDFIGTNSEFLEEVKSSQKNAQGVSMWEQYLNQVESSYNADIAAQKSAISKNIGNIVNNAYASQKQTTLAAQQSPNLLTGIKENLGVSDYLNTVKYYQQQGQDAVASATSNIAEGYSDVLTQAEEGLSETASVAQQMAQYFAEYSKVNNENYMSTGYYDNTDGNISLTREGQAYYDQILNQGIEGKFFTDYLADNNEDLYWEYVNNPTLYKELVGGLNAFDTSFSPSEYPDLIAKQEAKDTFISDFNAADNGYEITDIEGLTVKTPEDFDFNAFRMGRENSNQYKWVQDKLSDTYNNGDIVDFNYGAGKDEYMYYNGKWYKVKGNGRTPSDFNPNKLVTTTDFLN